MKSHSIKILILVIVCNITVLAGYYLLFQHIKTQAKAASSLTSSIDLSQQKNSRLNSLRSVVKDTEAKRQQLSTFLLSKDAEIDFIEQVEDLAKKSSLSEKTNNISSIKGDVDMPDIFQMQIEITGSWSNIMYFLNQLENLPYNIHVQGVSLNKQAGISKSSSSLWTATFDINVTENIQHE